MLEQQTFIPHSSGGRESKIRELSSLVSGEGSLPGLQMAAFLLCPHMAEGITSLLFLLIRTLILL